MRVTVKGSGSLGWVTGDCTSDLGLRGVCLGMDELNIGSARLHHEGEVLMGEPSHKELSARKRAEGRLRFKADASAIEEGDVRFIAVGNQHAEDLAAGSNDVQSVARMRDDLTGLRKVVSGLAFNPSTDDSRAAPSPSVTQSLLGGGALGGAFDLVAVQVAFKALLADCEGHQHLLEGFELAPSDMPAPKSEAALMMLTECKNLHSTDLEEMKCLLRNGLILDGLHSCNPVSHRAIGVSNEAVGRKNDLVNMWSFEVAELLFQLHMTVKPGHSPMAYA